MGIPPISTLASFGFYIAATVTVVVSCAHGELLWGGLILAAVMMVISCLEGLFYSGIGSWILGYMRAKSAHDTKEIKRYKRELKDEMIPLFLCISTCVAAAPLMLLSGMQTIVKVIGKRLYSCFQKRVSR